MLNRKNVLLIFLSLIIISLSISTAVATDDTNSTSDYGTTIQDDSVDSTDAIETNIDTSKESKTITKNENEVSVKDANTYYVSTTGKSSNSGTESSPYDIDTGFSKIKSEKSGNLILAGGTYKLTQTLKLNVAGSYTITGQSGKTVTLDGQNKITILYLGTNVDAKVTNIVFTNAKASEYGSYGGAINIDAGGTKVITNNTFKKNSAPNHGGAMIVKAEGTEISNNIFMQNSGTSGGALYITANNVKVTKNTFTQNTASNMGGAIYDNGQKITITNNVFSSNKAKTGGAINLYNGNQATITGNTFTLNTAEYGGAIYSNGNTTTISNNKFNKNSATNSNGGAVVITYSVKNVISNNEFTQNTAIKGGAVLSNDASNSEITGNTFKQNNVKEDGAALCLFKGSKNKVTNNQFTKNTANITGGAMYNDGTSVTFSNNIVDGNIAYRTGGAVYDESTGFTVTNNDFKNNIVYIKSDNVGDGAALYLRGPNSVVQNNKFTDNTAKGSGGALYLDKGGQATVSNNDFTGNKAGNNGGAIFTRGTSNKITSNTFAMNSGTAAKNNAIADYGSGNTISNNKNAATTKYTATIYNVGTKVTITNNEFKDTRPAATIVTVSSASAKVGYNMTLTASVKTVDGKAVTGGNLVFKINGKTVTSKISVKNGVATAQVVALKGYNNGKLDASYSGATDYLANKTTTSGKVTTSLNDAKIALTVSPTSQQQYGVIKFTVKVTDTATNKAPADNDSAFVIFKINGITVKDSNNQTLKVKVNNGVATYNYVVPKGMAGYTTDNKVRYYNVTAGYSHPNYNKVDRVNSKFTVQRSNVTITTSKVAVDMTSKKLTVNGKIVDSKNNNVVGKSKLGIKINGATIPINNSNVVVLSNGVIKLVVDLPSNIDAVNSITLVTGQTKAYNGYRTTITNFTKA